VYCVLCAIRSLNDTGSVGTDARGHGLGGLVTISKVEKFFLSERLLLTCLFVCTRSDLGIGCIVAFSVRISTLESEENHYSNREVDELDEQKVNFKSQPNKEKSYLCILPVMNR